MGHYINGIAGDQYEWEVWENLEYIGNTTIGKTPNHIDAQGYGDVLAATKQDVSQPLSPKQGYSVIERFVDALPKVAQAVQTVSDIAGMVAGSPAHIMRFTLGMIGQAQQFVPAARTPARLEL